MEKQNSMLRELRETIERNKKLVDYLYLLDKLDESIIRSLPSILDPGREDMLSIKLAHPEMEMKFQVLHQLSKSDAGSAAGVLNSLHYSLSHWNVELLRILAIYSKPEDI